MNDNEQHTVARCEARARDHGHAQRVWYPVDERLHASLCEICGAMGWVARSGDEERWRIGAGATLLGGKRLGAGIRGLKKVPIATIHE